MVGGSAAFATGWADVALGLIGNQVMSSINRMGLFLCFALNTIDQVAIDCL